MSRAAAPAIRSRVVEALGGPRRPRSCPVCGSKTLLTLLRYRGKAKRLPYAERLALVGCQSCGVAFSHPLPSERQLADFYSSSYWGEQKLSGSSVEKAARRHARKVEAGAHKLDLLSPWLDPGAERGPGGEGEGAARKALDFGAGTGEILDALTDRGWSTYGLEPSDLAREDLARRHAVVEAVPRKETFDLVTLQHVLEHLRDPLGVVRSLADALVPGGHLYVAVPDLGGLAEHRDLPYVVENGAHLFSFTRAGLSSVLSLAGLEVVAHLDGPEWDGHVRRKGRRLRCLARKSGRVAPLPANALEEAEEAVRAYAAAERAQERATPEADGIGTPAGRAL